MASVWYLDTNMVVRLDELKNRAGAAVEDATVEMDVLEDEDGETPAGVTLPVSMPHIADGTYVGILGNALDAENNAVLRAEIHAELPSGIERRWRETVIVRYSEG